MLLVILGTYLFSKCLELCASRIPLSPYGIVTSRWKYDRSRRQKNHGANDFLMNRMLAEQPADRRGKHGLKNETPDSIKCKLARGTFAAGFMLASLAAIELDGARRLDLEPYRLDSRLRPVLPSITWSNLGRTRRVLRRPVVWGATPSRDDVLIGR